MNHLSSLSLLFLSLLMLTACGPGKDRVRFEGKLSNISNAEFYAYCDDGSFDGVDTIRIEDGKFVYERQLSKPVLLTLLYPNYTQTYVILEPGKTIKMNGDAAKIGEADISGTAQNELLSDFRRANIAKPENDRRLAAAQFVRDHPATLAAVAVFRQYFTQPQTTDANTALQLLDILSKAQPRERAVAYTNDFFRPIFNNSVGETLPDFSAVTIDGRNVSSSAYKGKQLVIACVGTWQSESMEFLRQLRKRLKRAQEPWECLVVSLDVDREILRNRLKSDSVSYPVICDRQAFESPLVAKLGLHYVPSCMVVNTQGVIVQRDITRIDELKIN